MIENPPYFLEVFLIKTVLSAVGYDLGYFSFYLTL